MTPPFRNELEIPFVHYGTEEESRNERKSETHHPELPACRRTPADRHRLQSGRPGFPHRSAHPLLDLSQRRSATVTAQIAAREICRYLPPSNALKLERRLCTVCHEKSLSCLRRNYLRHKQLYATRRLFSTPIVRNAG